MPTKKKITATVAIFTANLFGAGSLLLFAVFLFLGPPNWMSRELSTTELILQDTALCLLFFLQHSIMIRKSFKRQVLAPVPEHYHGWIYTMASGLVLFILVIFWQESEVVIFKFQGGWRWLMRVIFLAGALGILWSVTSLRYFDAFGTRMLRAYIRQTKTASSPLETTGPYRFIRHPIYFFVLLMIWSYPDVTLDRLLFNLLFTGWMILAAVWEERDLRQHFGQEYEEYREKVPLLIPWKWGGKS